MTSNKKTGIVMVIIGVIGGLLAPGDFRQKVPGDFRHFAPEEFSQF